MQAFKQNNLKDNLNLENNKIEKKHTAVHEIGHALMQYILEKKIAFTTILPRYLVEEFSNNSITFSGYTAYGESEEELKNKIQNAVFFYNKIDCALAGIIAENEFFNIISTQGFEDQKNATTIAANLIKDGLGKKLKIVPAEQNQTFYQEIDELLEESKARTTKIIKENKELIGILAKKLEEKKILFGDEFAEIVQNYKSKQE